MLIVRKAKIIDYYQISPICPLCNSDMVRDIEQDIRRSDEIISAIDMETGEELPKYLYGYRCINSKCGHVEHSAKSYPQQNIIMDLAHAEYTPEEEFNNANK